MALKPTIYKMRIALSDLERNIYDTLNLTVAQHPSETQERMMARVMAYCFNVQERLAFSKGLSTPDEPDIMAHSLDDQLQLWIDVGEPAADRIKKATRIASQVKIYSFNTKSSVWWSQEQKHFAGLAASVFQFQWKDMQALAALVQRTMDIAVTLSDGTAYVTVEQGSCELSCRPLQQV